MTDYHTCGECRHYLGGDQFGEACSKYYIRLPKADTDATKCSKFRRKEVQK